MTAFPVVRAAWRERRLWAGLACSALFLFLAFHRTQWAGLASAAGSVRADRLGLAVLLFGISLVVRGLRWQILLAPVAEVSAADSLALINIGYLANNLLPLRAGELLRAALLAGRKNQPIAAILATIVVERLLDVLSLAILVPILVLVVPLAPGVKQGVVAGGAVALAAALALCSLGRGWLKLPTGAAPTLDPDRQRRCPPGNPRQGVEVRAFSSKQAFAGKTRVRSVLARAAALLGSFVNGLASLRSPGAMSLAATYSILSWAFVVLSTQQVLAACGLHLPLAAALTVIVVVNFGAAIPSSPGAIGVVHFLAMLGLGPWRVEPASAAEFALIFHAIPFLMTIGLGLLGLWWLRVPLQFLGRAGREGA